MQTRTQTGLRGCTYLVVSNPPCRTPAVVSTASRVEPIPRVQRMVGARRAAEEGRDGWRGRGESGSVRSCLLIPELTASLRVRQTPHPHCPCLRAETHTHTSPPCHLPYAPPPAPRLAPPPLCAPLVRVMGKRGGNRRWCRKLLLGFTLTHSQSQVDCGTARGV